MIKSLYVTLTCFKSLVVGPVSAHSANSHQGVFSRVQKANGMAERERGGENMKCNAL